MSVDSFIELTEQKSLAIVRNLKPIGSIIVFEIL